MKLTLALLWLVLITACLLLAGQAGLSLRDAVMAGGAASGGGEADVAAAGELAAKAQSRFDASQRFTEKLAQTDLLDSPTGGVEKPAWGGKDVGQGFKDAMDQAAEHWQRAEQARKLVARFAPLGEELSTPDRRSGRSKYAGKSREDLDQVRGTLEAFRQDFNKEFKNRVPGGERLLGLVSAELSLLDREIKRIDDRTLAESELAEANQLFRQGKYAECLDKLAANPLNRSTDPRMQATVDRLRRRCQYRVDWIALADLPRKSPEDLAAIEDFLEKHAQLPTGSTSERKARQLALRWRDDLELKIELDELKQTLAGLRQAGDLETLLTPSLRIVEHPRAKPADKAAARENFRDWLLTKALRPLPVPKSLRGLSEAVTQSGDRMIGVFYLPPGVVSYRFWKSRESQQSGQFRNGEVTPIPDFQFRDEEASGSPTRPHVPDVPAYTQWAERFNAALAALSRGGTAEHEWAEFAGLCETLQQDVGGYQQAFGEGHAADDECRRWPDDLANYAAIGRKVADRWEQAGRLLENN